MSNHVKEADSDMTQLQICRMCCSDCQDQYKVVQNCSLMFNGGWLVLIIMNHLEASLRVLNIKSIVGHRAPALAQRGERPLARVERRGRRRQCRLGSCTSRIWGAGGRGRRGGRGHPRGTATESSCFMRVKTERNLRGKDQLCCFLILGVPVCMDNYVQNV